MKPDVYNQARAEESASAWQRERFNRALETLKESGLILKVAEAARAVPGAWTVVHTEYGGADGRGLRFPYVMLCGPWSGGLDSKEGQKSLKLTFCAGDNEIGGLTLKVREDKQEPFGLPTETVAVEQVTPQQAEKILAAFEANPSREGLSPLLRPNPSSPSHSR